MRTEHNVGIDVDQRFELANDTNRLWIAIHGQKLEIAWTLIYNIVVKTGVNKLLQIVIEWFSRLLAVVIGLLKTPTAKGRLPRDATFYATQTVPFLNIFNEWVPSISTAE